MDPVRPRRSFARAGLRSANSMTQGSGHRATFEGDRWEADASRRAEAALARPTAVGATTSVPPAGGPLDPAVRSGMEAGFGHDFAAVRIFADDPGNIAAGLAARAVTIGRDIFFARGEYRAGGRELLAHELAHVVQQDLGAPNLAYRDSRDVDRIAAALRSSAAILRRSVRFLPAPETQDLVRSIAAVVEGFGPRDYGVIDQHGTVTRPSMALPVDQPVRRGSIRGTYRHELRFFLSEEPASEEGRYRPTPNGGEIRIFVPNVIAMTEPQLISVVAHELVHLFTHIIGRSTQFAHRLRATQAPQAPQAGTASSAGHPISLNISLADPSLGGNSDFAVQVDRLRQVYEPVVEFLNQARVGRSAQPLDRLAVAAAWAGQTADELLAFVIDEQVNVAVQFATQQGGAGRGLVAISPPAFDAVRFIRVYASRHWLEDPADRAALATPEALPILNRVGRSSEIRAVYAAVGRWVQRTRTP